MGSKTSFSDLVNNKSFMKKIVCMKDEKGVVDAFKKEGVIPTEEEMETLKEKFSEACAYIANCSEEEIKKLQEKGDDLTDEDLLNVSGGGKKSFTSRVKSAAKRGMKWFGENMPGLANSILSANQAEQEARKAETEADAKLKIKQMESNTQMFAVGAVTIVAVLYLFRDNIKKSLNS